MKIHLKRWIHSLMKTWAYDLLKLNLIAKSNESFSVFHFYLPRHFISTINDDAWKVIIAFDDFLLLSTNKQILIEANVKWLLNFNACDVTFQIDLNLSRCLCCWARRWCKLDQCHLWLDRKVQILCCRAFFYF